MRRTLTSKIFETHLKKGKLIPGDEITIGIDHVLLQDATGTMSFLEFEAMGVSRVKPELCIQYIDHNLMQADHKNMDDHLFLMTMASRFGVYCSLPGNGISHHIHKERFTKPGKTMVGADSHTPSSGGSAMLAIGVGGLDAAVAMATGEFTLTMPHIVEVYLTSTLQPWVSAMDVILDILRRIDVDGGTGKIFEFTGPGVATLSLEERSTICNMGAETGATTSIFPSDEQTRDFFKREGREHDYVALFADEGAAYHERLEIDLSTLEPLVACPYSPGNIKTLRDIAGIPIGQAMIGSSTNSSYQSFMRAAQILQRKKPHSFVSVHAIPGSRQLLETLDRDNGLMPLLRSGIRISEPSCNACIGMGSAPATGLNSVRSFPRNWEGRSGTEHDSVYLASPETVIASAITGTLIDPRDIGIKFPEIPEPEAYVIDDGMIIAPQFIHADEVKRGPNIKKIEYKTDIPQNIKGQVVIKVGNDISTDHILMAGAEVLPLRSNIPALSKYLFYRIDSTFYKRVKEFGGGIVVAGDNYGQGSSREHAAIANTHLGIQIVVAKSFARIHRKNLINFGVIPITFLKSKDYDVLDQGDELVIDHIKDAIKKVKETIHVVNQTKRLSFDAALNFTEKERDILLHGGLLNSVRDHTRGKS